MIIKHLYESLVKCVNELRITKTIDNNLWLSVSSTYSRNRSTEAENIKPMQRWLKEDLLARYVASLIISKKQCPETILDIDNNKTFKLIGKRYIELGGTFDEIKKLYIENGGKLVTKSIPASPTTIEKTLDKEIEHQLDDISSPVVQLLNNIPERNAKGYFTYENILSKVKSNYTDLSSICQEIYTILDTTYFYINRTFHEIDFGKYKIYFRDVNTNENQKIYHNDTHCIYITWVKVGNVRSATETTFCIVVNDMTINGAPISNKNDIGNNVVLSHNDLYQLCLIILAKLQYSQLSSFNNPLLPKNKHVSKSFGTFANKNKRRLDSEEIDKTVYDVLYNKVKKTYNTKSKCVEILKVLLHDEQLGNEDDGYKYEEKNGYIYKCLLTEPSDAMCFALSFTYDKNKKSEFIIAIILDSKPVFKTFPLWMIIDTGNILIGYNSGIYIHAAKAKEMIWHTIAHILYYANNYDEFIK